MSGSCAYYKRNLCRCRRRKFTEILLLLFCEKNSDGTKNLRLKGKDMQQRFQRRLDCEDMILVATFLKNHPEVVKLDLCYNNIGDEGLIKLVEIYLSADENTLKHLNLMSCSITGKGLERLCATAETLKLETFRINGNKLGFQGGTLVAELLGKTTTLKHLDVGDTDQTLATIQYFMSVIREDIATHNTLTVLDFSRVIPIVKTYQYDPEHLAVALGLMLKVNTVLRELHVQKNEFDGHDVELLLYGIKYNHTLLVMDLGYNHIADDGIELISNWIKTRPPLLGLNVAANGIGDTGARALSFGLPFSKVRLLDISRNNIGDDGMVDILNTIKKPYMMRMFFLWGNNLTPKTYQVIQRMLLSTVLVQEQIDVKLYTVDEVLCCAFYPADHYKQRYYCVMDHGCPIELRIKRNVLEKEYAQPNALIKFEYCDRLPLVDEDIPPKIPPC